MMVSKKLTSLAKYSFSVKISILTELINYLCSQDLPEHSNIEKVEKQFLQIKNDLDKFTECKGKTELEEDLFAIERLKEALVAIIDMKSFESTWSDLAVDIEIDSAETSEETQIINPASTRYGSFSLLTTPNSPTTVNIDTKSKDEEQSSLSKGSRCYCNIL